jgi:hypothetical protein
VTIPGTDAMGQRIALATRCLPDADGQARCLRACDPSGKTAAETQCGAGFLCLQSRVGGDRCMRAPLDPVLLDPVQGCVRELEAYEVHVGDAFVVTGSQTGFFSDEVAGPDGECEVPAGAGSYATLRQSRIPISSGALAACPSSLSGSGILDPLPSGFPANVCLAATGMQPATTAERRIHFENPIFSLGLVLPAGQVVPADFTVLTFQLVGGSLPLQLALGTDVVALDPRTIVTAPDRQTVFVVDQGRQTAATGVRGQLLRVSSSSQATDRSFIVR